MIHSRLPRILVLPLALLLAACLLSSCEQRAPAPPASSTAAPGPLPNTAQSIETAKKWLYEKVYYDHTRTFYCDCSYTRTPGQAGQINLKGCGLQVQRNLERAQRLEA